MDKSLTSEEKLLKLIKKKNKPVYSSQNVPVKDEKGSRIGIKKSGLQKESKFDLLGVLNRILILISLIIGAYIGYDQFYVKEKDAPVIAAIQTPYAESTKVNDLLGLEVKPFEYYQGQIEGQSLFESPWEMAKKEQEEQQVAPAIDFSKQLKIVGIVLDKDPKAILENLKTKESHFLSVGDEIEGAVITKIEQGKVALTYDDELYELLQ